MIHTWLGVICPHDHVFLVYKKNKKELLNDPKNYEKVHFSIIKV